MTDAANTSLDAIDHAILDELAIVHTLVDPPPADLDERVCFSIAISNLDAEVARVREDVLVGSGARSAERPRTITFDSESLTVMVTVSITPGGRRRLDGWLAPAGPLRVELRTGGRSGDREQTHAVTADDGGRFVVEGVEPGLAQLLVHVDEPGVTVVTPSVVL